MNYQKGRTFLDETKQKMSEAAKNRPPISEETRIKLSKRSKGRIGPWAGKKQPAEAIAKRAESNRGRKDSIESRIKKSIAAKIREENKRKQKELTE